MLPLPLYFGSAQQLFGWYHAASGPIYRACNIVLCRPIGHEYVCSYRAFRHLAEQLSKRGFSVLRFDYFATGNAAGNSQDSQLLRRWMDSITAAANELAVRAPNNRLGLVGLRFGATLAALTTLTRDDVDSLVLWEPCINGKSYMRQVKMLGMSTTEHPEQLAADLGVEAAGFHFSGATVDAISELQLTKSVGSTFARTLLMMRDDLPTDDRLASHLRTLGATVEERQFSRYDKFMTAPFKSELPAEAIHDIVQWFTDAYPEVPRNESATTHTIVSDPTVEPTRAATISEPEIPAPGATIQETAVRFGGTLFGIFAKPHEQNPILPAVILLNTGADHHVGPHRMYAPLARQWAARGFNVLRFDLAGLGDSPAHPDAEENIVYTPHAMDDIRTAVDYLASQGHRRVVLVGVCSGAYHAIHAAHAGIPVIGTIAVNPPLYFREGDTIEMDPYWNEAEAARVGRAMFAREKWARFFTGKIDYKYTMSLLVGRAKNMSITVMSKVGKVLTRQQSKDSEKLVALFPRGVRTHLIFSRDDPGFTYIERSVGPELKPLRANPDFSVEVVEGADHTFMPARWQDRLTELLTDVLYSRFSGMVTPQYVVLPNRHKKLTDAP